MVNFIQVSDSLPGINYFKQIKLVFLNIHNCAWKVEFLKSSHMKLSYFVKAYGDRKVITNLVLNLCETNQFCCLFVMWYMLYLWPAQVWILSLGTNIGRCKQLHTSIATCNKNFNTNDISNTQLLRSRVVTASERPKDNAVYN